MSFFTERSDLNGSSDRQNAMSRHWRASSVSRKRWQSFSTMLSACFSFLFARQCVCKGERRGYRYPTFSMNVKM